MLPNCCDEAPQTGGLGQQNRILSATEATRWRCQGPHGLCGSGGCQESLACGHITPGLAPVCLCLFSWGHQPWWGACPAPARPPLPESSHQQRPCVPVRSRPQVQGRREAGTLFGLRCWLSSQGLPGQRQPRSSEEQVSDSAIAFAFPSGRCRGHRDPGEGRATRGEGESSQEDWGTDLLSGASSLEALRARNKHVPSWRRCVLGWAHFSQENCHSCAQSSAEDREAHEAQPWPQPPARRAPGCCRPVSRLVLAAGLLLGTVA